MLLLTSTSDLVQIITTTTAALHVQAAYVDDASGVITPGRLNSVISSATTTTVVASPAASTQRAVRGLSVWNTAATASNGVTLQHTDGTSVVIMWVGTLLAGTGVQYTEGYGWQPYSQTPIVITPPYAELADGDSLDCGRITEAVTSTDDWGAIQQAVLTSNDLGDFGYQPSVLRSALIAGFPIECGDGFAQPITGIDDWGTIVGYEPLTICDLGFIGPNYAGYNVTIFGDPVNRGVSVANAYNITTVKPLSTSTAIVASTVGEVDYAAGASLINGGGHMIGALGNFWNFNTTQTLPLCIGAEGKINQQLPGNHIGTAISVDCNLGINGAGCTIDTWFGSYSDVGNNAGTMTIAAGFAFNMDANTGTISNLAGLYVPGINSSTGTITTFYGYFFGTQTVTIGTKYAIFNQDPNAPIFSFGQLQMQNLMLQTPVATSALPTPTTALRGARYFVTDATSSTFNAAPTGGGSIFIPVFCNGSAWLIG